MTLTEELVNTWSPGMQRQHIADACVLMSGEPVDGAPM
jgi:hypothetical protein